MTDVNAASHAFHARTAATREPLPQSVTSPASFRDVLMRNAAVSPPSRTERAILDAARGIERGERLLDRVIAGARNGQSFTNEQLISIQAGVYRYTQALDLASKLVDKLTGAVRQTLQSQQ